MKYFCDYCDAYLTHDSPSVRKTHCSGRKHKENVHIFYKNWMEEQAQSLIDATTAAFKAGKIPKGAAIPPPPGMTSVSSVPGSSIGQQHMPPQGPMGNMGPPRMGMPPMGPGGPMMGNHSFMGPSGIGMPPVMMTGMPNGPGAPWRPQHMPPQGPMGNMGPPVMGGNMQGNMGPPGMGGNMQGNMGMQPMLPRGPMMGGPPMMGPPGPGMPPSMMAELHQS